MDFTLANAINTVAVAALILLVACILARIFDKADVSEDIEPDEHDPRYW